MRHNDPYLPAKDLDISEKNRQILIGLAHDLAAEKIPNDDWSMENWNHCIWGNLKKRGAVRISIFGGPGFQLFAPQNANKRYSDITQLEAAAACYNFLTTGEARWHEVTK